MRIFYIVLGVLAVAAIAAVVAFVVLPTLGDDEPARGSGVEITDADEVGTYALAFVQPPYRDDYNNLRLAGYVDNIGSVDLISVQLEIEVRDSANNRLLLVEHATGAIPVGQRAWFDLDQGTFGEPGTASIKVISVEAAR